jgi:hypothetical protein
VLKRCEKVKRPKTKSYLSCRSNWVWRRRWFSNCNQNQLLILDWMKVHFRSQSNIHKRCHLWLLDRALPRSSTTTPSTGRYRSQQSKVKRSYKFHNHDWRPEENPNKTIAQSLLIFRIFMELPAALLLLELQLQEPTLEAERRWKLNKNIHQLEQTPQVEEEFKSLW